MGLTYEEIKARIKAPDDVVWIAFESGPGRELADAQSELSMAEVRLDADPKNTALKTTRAKVRERVKQAKEAAREQAYPHRLKALPKPTLEALIKDTKPTAKQIEKWEADGRQGEPPYDLDLFPPKLVAACSVDPVLTEVETKEMWFAEDSPFTEAMLGALFYVANRLCQIDGVVDLGKDSAST